MKVKEDQGRPSRLRQWFPQETAAPGSKRWYREKKIEHVTLWFMPFMPLGYVLSAQGVSMPWPVLAGMLLPVVGVGGALGFTSYALWRIEINVAGNREHPFTMKDDKVLGRCGWAFLFSLLFAIAVNSVLRVLLTDASDTQLRFMDTGENTAVIVFFVGATVTSTMKRIHCKARDAYEELEKGV